MKYLFYNSEQQRIRSGWRLLLHSIIWFFGTAIFSSVLIMIPAILLTVTGQISFDNPTGIQNEIMSYPWTGSLSSLGSLMAILFATWAGSKMDKRPLKDYGFHFQPKWWIDWFFGLALGAILMAFIFVFELAMGWVKITGFFTDAPNSPFLIGILFSLITFFCVGISEELLSRGYQMTNLAEGFHGKIMGPKAALLLSYFITSAIFGFLHLSNPNATLLSSVMLIFAGILLGLGFVLTGSLAIPIGLHMTWNFFEGNVFGFEVSGISIQNSFIGIQTTGPDLWTGGAFGPEAGLSGLLAIIIGCILIAVWVKIVHKRTGVFSDIAVYRKPGLSSVCPQETTRMTSPGAAINTQLQPPADHVDRNHP